MGSTRGRGDSHTEGVGGRWGTPVSQGRGLRSGRGGGGVLAREGCAGALWAGVRLRPRSLLHLQPPPPPPRSSVLHPKTPGSCQPSPAPEAPAGLCSGCSCTPLKPSPCLACISFSLWSPERPSRGPLQARCPHNLGPSLFRGHPETWAWPLHPHFLAPALLLQGQPGAPSSRKPSGNTSTLHKKGVLLAAPGPKTVDSWPSAFSTQDFWFLTCLAMPQFPTLGGGKVVCTHRGGG